MYQDIHKNDFGKLRISKGIDLSKNFFKKLFLSACFNCSIKIFETKYKNFLDGIFPLLKLAVKTQVLRK